MGDFLSFRKMIAPTIIQIIFWVGVIACVVFGLAVLAGGDSLQGLTPVSPTVMGLLIIILGPIAVRVYCEILMVWFRIYESIRGVERNTARGTVIP